ncbi:MAG TPA: ABC transporter ATP-binding protein [Burkholderiaceae bacterium]|nr:ABC transporter ATP-binding protein [Burkholderiaceae bacterium]
MIRLEGLTKRYDGVAAVDGLTLHIAEGETCVLIGPSGCGKTTTMRMVNRMIEPNAGRIEVGGRDVTHIDAVELRRSVGYVIQQVGLFPHWTIADNVATVPRLLGWNDRRIATRVDELLQLVGLEPAQFRARWPRELSGGQKQRVGVARALAADPPVMLMDEPFGAIDPITRAHLQDEFLRILQRLKKTIVFVTHDIDEAIKMGSRIAILRAGRLVQVDSPAALLAAPKDDFVEAFVGADRALKRLSLLAARDHLDGAAADAAPAAHATSADTSLRDALAQMLALGTSMLRVIDLAGQPLGALSLASIMAASRPATPSKENP